MNAAATSAHPDACDDDEPPPPGPSVVVADERTANEPVADLEELADLLRRVLGAEGAPATAEASLTLVDPERIAALKAEHLDGDGSPTDVLSFPVDGAAHDAQLVGDVVVCPAVAAAQASTHAGRIEDELRLLVVHGALHLAGWDHDSAEAERDMWARERDLLGGLGMLPPLDPWDGRARTVQASPDEERR